MIYPHNNITEGSQELLARGIRVLQGNRFASAEEDHLQKLIDYMELSGRERSVADMGCGFGEVSVAMAGVLPEAQFYLVNTNEFQLSQCPQSLQFNLLCEDMTNTSIADGLVDLIMFNYSLCHVLHFMGLLEAAEIATKGAKLFVYDYARTGGNNELSEVYLYSHFKSDREFKRLCQKTGWKGVETIYPGGDDTLFREAMNNDELYDAIFEDLVPVIWRAHR